MDIKRVGVIGAGAMGSGIAQVCAMAGFDVMLCDIDPDRLSASLAQIGNFIRQGVEKGRYSPEAGTEAIGRIKATADLAAAVIDCQFLIEAICEDMRAKKALFAELGRICGPTTIS